MPYTEVIDQESGNTLIRVEYYQEHNPRTPTAYERFLARQGSVPQEVQDGLWNTIVYDSVSSLEPMVRVNSRYFLNRDTAKESNHWIYSTDQLEELLAMRVGGLHCHVVTVAHVDSQKDEVRGTFVYTPAFPGRLRQNIGKDYTECYYQTAGWNEETKDYFYQLQTRTREQHAASSQIKAPDPCSPSYSALWVNWPSPPRPIHCLVYGQPGTGKSTFAATFPKPMLVFMFDSFGKEMPYLDPAIGLALPVAD